MKLRKPAFAMLEFLAAEPRLRTASPAAVTLFLRAFHLFEAFDAAHPHAVGADHPQDEMLPRLCGMNPAVFNEARAELMQLGLWEDEGDGGIGLGPLPAAVWQT